MNKLFVSLIAVLLSATATGELLTAEEQRMAAWIDAHADDAIALLKETVDIPSGTLNLDGVRAVGRVMQRELDAVGLQTVWIEMPPEMGRAGHLFGRKDGSGMRAMMTAAWTESGVARAASSWTQPKSMATSPGDTVSTI